MHLNTRQVGDSINSPHGPASHCNQLKIKVAQMTTQALGQEINCAHIIEPIHSKYISTSIKT